MPNIKLGTNARRLPDESDGWPGGYAADCPFCGETATAPYDRDMGRLVWWNDADLGNGCVNYTGAYASGGLVPAFYFR